MTFRRRLLVVTVTLGVGILCFQPVMRVRMASAISNFVGAKVDINESRISLFDGTMAFRNIVVHHSDKLQGTVSHELPRQSNIEHAALKFNWNSLLFRNLRVESFVASNVHWKMEPPSRHIIPSAAESIGQISLVPSDANADTDATIEPIVSPIHSRIVQEAARQSRVHLDVSTRIKKALEQLGEAMPAEGSFNVLRQSFVVDDAKKTLATIKQSIAENRLARKESDRVISSLKQSAQKNLNRGLAANPELDSSRINQASLQLAKHAVAREWNSNRSVVQAVLLSFNVAQTEINPHNGPPGDGLRDSQNEFLSQLPVGATCFVAGKMKGVVQFPNVGNDSPSTTSGFQFQFRNLSSRDSLERETPAICLTMNNDPAQNAIPWLVCTAQQTKLPQSDADQIQITLERVHPGQKKSTTSIQHANQGWAATISIPIRNCFELAAAEPLRNANSPSNESIAIVGKLVGTTSPKSNEPNELFIDIDISSVNALAAILAPEYRSVADRKRLQSSIRGTELLNSELQSLSLRWDQLGDEHSRLHEGWEVSLNELNDQLQSLESAMNRTSRNSNSFTR